jgi:hypothetical protein
VPLRNPVRVGGFRGPEGFRGRAMAGPTERRYGLEFTKTHHLVALEGAAAEVEKEPEEHGHGHAVEDRARHQHRQADQEVDAQACRRRAGGLVSHGGAEGLLM